MARKQSNTSLSADVESLFNLVLRIQDKVDNTRYRNALLALKTGVKELKIAAVRQEVDERISVKGGRQSPKIIVKEDKENPSPDMQEEGKGRFVDLFKR